MMNALRKAARGGCKVVSINNLKEVALERFASPQDPVELLTPKATTISNAYFTPKLGGDMAFVRGMVKTILARNTEHKESNDTEIIDNDFINNNCLQFEDYINIVNKTSWASIEQQSGLSINHISAATDIFLHAKTVICTWAMGITQHKHSVVTIQEIVNLQLISGNIGKQGAGLCPVRGHSNVQGNRTMGINEKPSEAFIKKMAWATNTSLPKAKGHNVYYALKALLNKQSKVLISLGGNIAQAAPDSKQTHQALMNTKLNVQISTKLNRSHLCVGKDALILPCLGRTEIDKQASGEQYITVEDTFSMVHASQGNVPPLSSMLKSETAIIADIAAFTLAKSPQKSTIDWQALKGNYDLIRDLIEQSIDGFTNFNKNLVTPGGFYLGNSAAKHHWNTPSNKALFAANKLPETLTHIKAIEVHSSAQKQQTLYTLQSLRSHDQYNTTIYGMNDRYRGIVNARNILFINKKDALKQGFENNQEVDITSIWPDNQHRMVSNFRLCFYDIPQGNLAAYYPETNPLIPLDSVGERSFTPTSKSVAVILNKAKHPNLI
jgi:molybdopterin-dependent oxidoreductase alpha subunit